MSKKVLILSGSPPRAVTPIFCAMNSSGAPGRQVTRWKRSARPRKRSPLLGLLLLRQPRRRVRPPGRHGRSSAADDRRGRYCAGKPCVLLFHQRPALGGHRPHRGPVAGGEKQGAFTISSPWRTSAFPPLTPPWPASGVMLSAWRAQWKRASSSAAGSARRARSATPGHGPGL